MVKDNIYVAFQQPFNFTLNNEKKEFLARTFEDAFVATNVSFFENLEGDYTGYIKKFKDALYSTGDGVPLNEKLFEILKTKGKTEFALDVLYKLDNDTITTPEYISNGLIWLNEKLTDQGGE